MVDERIGEVISANSAGFTAECYQLHQAPPLGALVKARNASLEIYGVVCDASTTGIDPGRRPVARGRDEASEEDIYRAHPQLTQLLRTEFSALVVGHREEGRLRSYLPPQPARLHSFVYPCQHQEIREFTRSLDFLLVLCRAEVPPGAEELVAACLRQASRASEKPRAFLVAAGKELATFWGNEPERLNAVLRRIRE